MTNPAPTPAAKSGYQPAEWEDAMNALWLESGLFSPDVCVEKGVAQADAPVFSMVLPPPNATGTLHTGSAAMLAIEDAFTRFARMQGKRTLWLPGTDHAAIATQSKVERLLWEQEQKTRYDLGREELLRRIDTFVEKNRDTMKNQMRKMGSSLDWSREAFTLDGARHQAVHKAFKQMYDEGVIYRGDRIVNWDPKGQTTISDDEIVHKEETTTFYYFQYGPFEISTARPETKFGDKYVVMHPADERYAEYQHGQTIEIEWINGPLTTTVIKDASVDPEFGTGVMTITPWHSTVDFEIAERHGLEKE
jgi:valyl-tRNA synthetase